MYHDPAERPSGWHARSVEGTARAIIRALTPESARGGAQVAFKHAQSAGTDAAYEMIKRAEQAFGRIDFTDNNAAVTRDNLPLCAKEEVGTPPSTPTLNGL